MIDFDALIKKAENEERNALLAKQGQKVNTAPYASAQGVLPRLPDAKITGFGDVQTEYNMSLPGIGNVYAKSLPRAAKEKIAADTQRAFEQNPAMAGFMQGVALDNPLKQLERKIGVPIDTSKAQDALAYKAGNVAGIGAQYLTAYGLAGSAMVRGAEKIAPALPNIYKGAGNIVSKAIPKLSQDTAQGIGKGIVHSGIKDIGVGVPLNLNQVISKEEARGQDIAKRMALYTGLDLALGGVFEVVGGVILKNGKKVSSQSDFDALTPAERREAVLMLPAPKQQTGEGTVIAGGQSFGRQFVAMPKDKYADEVAKAIGEYQAPMWGNWNSPYGKKAKSELDNLDMELSSVLKMTPEQWDVFARENNLGSYKTDFGQSPKGEATGSIPQRKDMYYAPAKEVFAARPDISPVKIRMVAPKAADSAQFKQMRKDIANDVKQQPWYGRMLTNNDPEYTRQNGALTGRIVASTINKNQSYKGANGERQLSILKNLDEIFENAVVIQSRAERGGNTNINKIHTLLSPVEFPDGLTGVVKLNVKEYADPSVANKIHENKLLEIIKEPEVYAEAAIAKSQADIRVSGSKVRISDLLESVKGTEYYPKNKSTMKDLGADTNRVLSTTEENIERYGKMKPGEKLYDAEGNLVTRDVEVPKATAYGENQQFARTIQESPIIDDTFAKEIEQGLNEGFFTKHTKSNKTAVEDASRRIEENIDRAYGDFTAILRNDSKIKGDDIALGLRLAQKLQESGEYSKAMEVCGDLSVMLSEAGRTLQAAQIAKRLSPEGRLLMLKRSADKIEKTTGVKPTLSDETLEQISKANGEGEIAEANKKAFVEMWNQVPPRWIDKLNAWRYMAMLANPKTHIRNIVGNAMFVPAVELKNIIGAGLEKAMKTESRTKSVLTPGDGPLINFANSDFKNVEGLLKNEGKYEDNIRKLDAKVFNFSPLEKLRQISMNAMDKVDVAFMKRAYSSSLAQWMKANRLTAENITGEALQRGREYASNEALKATYRDFNSLSNAISKAKRNMWEKPGVLPKAGSLALESAMPFTKTPINILRRGLEYSPAGLIRGISDMTNGVKSGKVTATEAIDHMAAGLSGTAVLMLGAFLADKGIVKSTSDSKPGSKKENFERLQGEQNYSLNLGDLSFTIDWAAPLSMPFFVGAEMQKMMNDEGFDIGQVLDGMTSITDPMFNLSMLQGINEMVKGGFGEKNIAGTLIGNLATGYAGQYIPTVLGQVARTIDDTRRTTTSTDESKTLKQVERFGRQTRGKIPGLSAQNEPYVDLWGRNDTEPNAAMRAFENFVSPGYIQKNQATPVDKAIIELAGQLKADGFDSDTINAIYPRKTSNYILESDGQEYRMTEKELTKYNQVKGQTAYKKLEALLKMSIYKSSSPEGKMSLIEKQYTAAGHVAKNSIIGMRTGKSTATPEISYMSGYRQEVFNSEIRHTGVKPEKYEEILMQMHSFNEDGEKTAVNQKDAREILDGSGLSKEQKSAVWQAINKSWKNNPYSW